VGAGTPQLLSGVLMGPSGTTAFTRAYTDKTATEIAHPSPKNAKPFDVLRRLRYPAYCVRRQACQRARSAIPLTTADVLAGIACA
jgi:hypothetical protein